MQSLDHTFAEKTIIEALSNLSGFLFLLRTLTIDYISITLGEINAYSLNEVIQLIIINRFFKEIVRNINKLFNNWW